MGWSRRAPKGITFAQAALADYQARTDKHDSKCDCDSCCWEASQRALAARKERR